MARLNYLNLFVSSFFGNINKVDLVALCLRYRKDKERITGFILQNQWRHSTFEDIASCLKWAGYNNNGVCDDACCFYDTINAKNNNLWLLYLNLQKNKPYGFEVEKLLIDNIDADGKGFEKMPHALSEAGEELLIDSCFAVMGKTYDSYNYGESFLGTGYFSINRLNRYIERFSLSKKAFAMLVEKSLSKHTSENLVRALHILSTRPKPSEVIDDELRCKLILTPDMDMRYGVVSAVLRYYNMLIAPSWGVLSALLNNKQTSDAIRLYLSELLSHSWLEEGKETILKLYPHLKLKVLIADITHIACKYNRFERKVMESAEYIKLLNREDVLQSSNLQAEDLPDKRVSMVILCRKLYLVKQNKCEFGKILEMTISYCQFFNDIPELKKFVPQLLKFKEEYK